MERGQFHLSGESETVAAQPRHLHRLLAFFDPLLRRAPFIVEPHHRPAGQAQVRDNSRPDQLNLLPN